MLKFTTIQPLDPSVPTPITPLIRPREDCRLADGTIRGTSATIVGRALTLAGYPLPCFYDGDIEELDRPNPEILMVIPSGIYPIKASINPSNEYLLDLAN